MLHRIAASIPTTLSLIALLAFHSKVAAQSEQPADPFALDGSRNILHEDHFGIVNGKLAAGIPYRHVLGVRGLWAPPYVSSDFQLDLTVLGQPVVTERYTWHPFHVERSGTVQGIAAESVTMLVPGTRAGVMEITLANPGTEQRTVPVEITVGGTLDAADKETALGASGWLFAAPKSQTATTRKIEDGSLVLEQGGLSMVLRASRGVEWQGSLSSGKVSLSLPSSGSAKLYVAFAIGPSAEAKAACRNIATAPEQMMAAARTAYVERVAELFHKLPRLQSSSPALDRFYNRSLVPLLMNRWDVDEFVLQPYYSTGSVNGGCVGNYLWDFGGNWEIFPLVDPEATKTHIKHFLSIDITKHFAFDPLKGKAWGPWYPVNQEKIVGSIYYYVKQTGDVAFLKEVVSGKTILEHAIANAMFGDDPAHPVRLIDYGPSNSHLELRRGIPYNHIMPDLNGRRYENYAQAAQLAELVGQPAPQLRERAEELKGILKQQLWNEEAKWFAFQNDKGQKDLRYTVQVFKLFSSKVLDAGQEAGLLDHLNDEREFMAEFGLESMAKTDLAYDPVDYDNGGGGCFTAFPAQIAERLYKAGHPEVSEKILKRILWWGERVPYWGDSFAANEIEYRRDTPLQCTIDSAAAAQCLLFGMFGVRAEFNGDIRIDPHPPAFAPQMELKGLRLRGRVLDIRVDGREYEVREGDRRIRQTVGHPTVLPSR
jgi:hypothetical protein